MTGKIMKGIAGFYYVNDGTGNLYECKAKGVFRNKKIKPLVGDNVEFSILDEAEMEGNIDAILPRKNALIRPAVANVDQAMVVFAVSHPEPNFHLLDRFLVMMELQKVPVIICFNKAELGEAEKIGEYRSIYERAGYQVLFISTYEDKEQRAVRELLKGKTTVLAGPSGVGKSSLTNCIQPEAFMETGDISRKIERGKHTTRHSELFYIEKDTYMMDTPGFSSIFTPEIEAGELKDCFPEFAPFEEDCRFLGCVHVGERVCGVKDALEKGLISSSRYANYLTMYKELKDRRKY
ncbi:ribosome small subunit-dependent GTPase A [Lacrimispora sp. 210928-DFI.3.58]|mgnify:CR=1 FL=1|uniref:ribosome small subunit-dependent GTPase A n=1 Tax=Lacrimispora sp. 210928-DFI.3.58 TaxID=2883214 RepID=UPI0015B3AD3F|nr:ribosome small subunit-dependent GTPase A [Lacrimispora sp. 210928-DFI.3.58]MCB7319739.1 ribosome small subunit-dependent GTPase A [Lacrimispora sp. 210928-DFI.3.58]